MGAIVGIDARIDIAFSSDGYTAWTQLSERNEFSISISVDSAEHKVFVANLAAAWVEKARTWMAWSGSISGYYDDASNTIFNTVIAGETVKLRFYTSQRKMTHYWEGLAVLTSVEHSVGTDDFATLSVDFEGQGALTRVSS